jgi:hypothetical protein
MFRYLAAAPLVFGAAALLPSNPAPHSWYPQRRCIGNDCFLADNVRRLPDGTLELSTGTIVDRIARSFPIEASPDGKPHFCIYDSGWGFRRAAFFCQSDHDPDCARVALRGGPALMSNWVERLPLQCSNIDAQGHSRRRPHAPRQSRSETGHGTRSRAGAPVR